MWSQAVPSGGVWVQPGLDEMGTPLHEVTFVVVDLETTGTRAADCAITEVGAVKVRGGQVLGELSTLVDPGGPIPPAVQVLTGITTSMVVGAPRIEQVLPAFLEFVRGSVLVAHNAPFDIGFLKAALSRAGYTWPGNQVVDTVALARRVVTRDEAPNHRLATLARLFGATTTPTHRALDDARATVDVLHALLERLAPLGVAHAEDLATAADRVPDKVRRRRHLADRLPDAPGVYLFRGPGDEVLYAGVATVSLRSRVRTYFTAAERRARMTEMLALATRVDPIVCATPLEAQVRELRLIAEHAPRYNRRSRAPGRMPWVRLTDEPYPRLSVVRDVTADATHIGPFVSAATAKLAVEALHETFAVRRCATRLPARPRPEASACTLADLGRCPAPCVNPDEGQYATVAAALRSAMTGDPTAVVAAHAHRLATLVATERFEEAATTRDRLAAYLRAASRAQRFDPLARSPELVAAHRHDDTSWELVVIRHGRLAATTVVPPGHDPRRSVDPLRATAEHVTAPVPPSTAAHPEETDLLLAWLDRPGTRLVAIDGTLAWPVRSAAAITDPATAVATWHDHPAPAPTPIQPPSPDGSALRRKAVDRARWRRQACGPTTRTAMRSLLKYPRTPHLAGSRLQPGDEDLSQVPFAALAGKHLVVEEKLDGANCGLSFGGDAQLLVQSRGHYLTGGAREKHFNLLKSWAAAHEDALFDVLGSRYIMYGEWMYAKHTVFYDRLPHYFLEFDLFDTEQEVFLSTAARRQVLDGLPVVSVPVLYDGSTPGRLDDLLALVGPSLGKSSQWRQSLHQVALQHGLDPELVAAQTQLSDLSEGLYVKVEDGDVTTGRLKWVRAGFVQSIADDGTHWLARPVVPNQLAPGADIYSPTPVTWETMDS